MDIQTPASTTKEAAVPETRIEHGEGLVGGLIGAATIAAWFFVLDCLKGRPFFTPSILGSVVFGRLQAFNPIPATTVSFEMVFVFTWFHGLVFCALGWVAAWLIYRAEQSPHYGYGIVLLVVVLMSGFLVGCLILAEPVLHALTVPAVLVGNLLATLAMGGFFWYRHPGLKILP